MFRVLSLLISCFFLCNCFGQTYQFSFKENKVEIISAALLNTGIMIYDHHRPFEPVDFSNNQGRQGVWKFDRSAIGQNSYSAKTLSDKLLYGSLFLPLSLGLSKSARNDEFGNILLLGAQGLMVNTSVNSLVKIIAARPRPYVYQHGEEFADIEPSKNDTKSFYSGHTSTTAYMSFFTAKAYADLHPDSKFKPVVWGLAATVPALTGYLRYKAGRHFPSDIITGYIVGAGFGILIPSIYRNDNVNISPRGLGLGLQVKL